MAAEIIRSGIEFQERDLALLRGLFESRVMTSKHVAALYFDGRTEAAKKRLQKLKAAGLVSERPRRAYEPSLLFLGTKAFRLLSDRGCLADYPKLGSDILTKRTQVSALTLRHELDVMDVKTALVGAVAKTRAFRTAEFSTWPMLNQFCARRPSTRTGVLVKPDGFIRILESESDGGAFEHTFFLELDRSTETQETLADKAGCYLDHYKSGGLAIRFGQPRSAYKDFPFRVLMVFKNAERRNNTAERLIQNTPPILTQTWLTTFQEIVSDPLGGIWMRPFDYREATRSSAFDPDRQTRGVFYRRQGERDRFVESRVPKTQLLTETA